MACASMPFEGKFRFHVGDDRSFQLLAQRTWTREVKTVEGMLLG